MIVLIALLAAGLGLSVLGNRQASAKPIATPEVTPHSGTIDTPFVLTLSAPAKQVSIESLGQTFTFDPSTRTISGTLPVVEGHPTLFIDIVWADPEPSPRFAKLVLEPAGHPTQSKIFDSTRDLSDVWELHLHHDEHE